MEFYAHTKEDDPNPENWQLLKDHLKNVAELAKQFAQEAKPNDENFAKNAGIPTYIDIDTIIPDHMKDDADPEREVQNSPTNPVSGD